MVAGVLYLPALKYEFVYDDEYFVLRNESIRSWSNVPRYFYDRYQYAVTHKPIGMWRPLRNISYLLDYKAAGLSPVWFHAHNILLHAANAAIVFWVLLLCSRFIRPVPIAIVCASALVWTVHPVNVEAVAWVKSRDELLFNAFYLLAFVGFLKWMTAPSRRTGILILMMLAYFASLMSKEMAASLPILMFAAWFYFPRVRTRREFAMALAAAAIMTVIYVAWRHVVVGRTSQMGLLAGTWSAQALTMIRAAAKYIQLAFAPSAFLADYSGFPISRSPLDPRVIVAVIVLAIYAAAIIILRRRASLASFGLLWFAITLLPVSNIIPTMQFLAERFMYLPIVGIAMVAQEVFGLLQSHLMRHGRRPAVTYALAALLICALTFSARARLPVWRNDLVLNDRTYYDSPPSERVTMNYAIALANYGRYLDALKLLRGIEETPYRLDPGRLHQTLGLAYMMNGNLDEGATHTLKALRYLPDDYTLYSHMAYYYRQKGNRERAIEYARLALARNQQDKQMQRYLRELDPASTATVQMANDARE